MPTSYEYYLNNQDDRIADQKKMERSGSGVLNALMIGGTVAGFLLARKKISLSRGFSKGAATIGKAAFPTSKLAGDGLSKYIIGSEIEHGRNFLSKVPSIVRNWREALAKPLPGLQEQFQLQSLIYKKHFPEAAMSGLPSFKETLPATKGWSTFRQGPAYAAIAPKAQLGVVGAGTSGSYGGMVFGKTFYQFDARGHVTRKLENVVAGLPSMGGRMEEARLLAFSEPYSKTIEKFTRTNILNRRGIFEESQDIVLRKYLRSNLRMENVISQTGRQVSVGEASHKDMIDFLRNINMHEPGTKALRVGELFEREARTIRQSYKQAIKTLVGQEVKKPTTKAAYAAYKAQHKLGVGEVFARHAYDEDLNVWKMMSLRYQKFENHYRKLFESGWVHPESGRKIPWQPRDYRPKNVSLTGKWPASPGMQGMSGEYYATQAGEHVKRSVASIVEGTAYRIPEELLGFGITARKTALTDFISKFAGASPESWGGYAIRRHAGGLARVLGIGFAAYYGFRLVNYMARQATGGWGVTDVAGKAYTSSRVFQQESLDRLGLTEQARKTEKAFPGALNSPASRVFRLSAPLWAAGIGKKLGGVTGAGIGLAMGIAFALITWGDMTQSPEELREIYSGERDIPIRKGRYWPFGKTPWGGGKIMYWRPHWYPMMRSRYRHKGQLWDSETEELAQGTLLSPILAPILQGKMWDPYYWEKKHYHDRPYPMTGEMFEPTMPLAGLANLTIGRLIKPQRIMHPEYWNNQEYSSPPGRGNVPGAASRLGMQESGVYDNISMVSPDSESWNAGLLSYNLIKQMGLRGYLFEQAAERITGRPQFLPEGPVVQTARRATGYEREYWDLNIGDPGGYTEWFRRMLPRRRQRIEEWNPIRNTMPEWMPGSEYYTDFQHGDPYIKVEMGEARLPGPGYESLHRLHSGVPGTYDAVDRFLVLADIAPYSDQYHQYKTLAMGMTKDDSYWRDKVKRKIQQRAATQKEYDFLELEPPEDVTGATRILSKAYRRTLATITGTAPAWEKIPLIPSMGAFALPMSPVNKLMPYKTAEDTYKQSRIYGRDFTTWTRPGRDFVMPWAKSVAGLAGDAAGMTYIPESEKKLRSHQEYFDRLEYVKHKKLSALASEVRDEDLKKEYDTLAGQTMTGLNIYGRRSDIYRAMPRRERAFFEDFLKAQDGERDRILDMVPRDMQKLYKAQWNIIDRKSGEEPKYDVSRTASRDVVEYFRQNKLPAEGWAGWHPGVDMQDVKLKVIKQEGMDMHDFGMWWGDERRVSRRRNIPSMPDIGATTHTNDMIALRKLLYDQLSSRGFEGQKIEMTRTPSANRRININFNVKKDRKEEYQDSMMEYINAYR